MTELIQNVAEWRDRLPYLASHRGASVSAMVDIVKRMSSKNVFRVDSV